MADTFFRLQTFHEAIDRQAITPELFQSLNFHLRDETTLRTCGLACFSLLAYYIRVKQLQ